MVGSTFDAEKLACLGHEDVKDASTKDAVLFTEIET